MRVIDNLLRFYVATKTVKPSAPKRAGRPSMYSEGTCGQERFHRRGAFRAIHLQDGRNADSFDPLEMEGST